MLHQQQQLRLQQQQQYYASNPTQAPQRRIRKNTNARRKRPGFPSRATMVFSIFQIIFGGICVILGITAVVIRSNLRYSGAGIWCGVVFAVAGSLGIAASLKKTNTMIITTMILSIISATVAAGAYIISIMAAVNEKTCPWYLSYCHTSYDGRVAVDSIVAVLAFAELVIATLQSVFYFSAYCCNQKPSASTMYSAARSAEETSHDFPNAVIQNEPTQHMTPSGVEFVQHYPNQQPVPQGYLVNLKKQPVVTSNQQPSIQLQPQPGVVYQQEQGQQLPRQQSQLQQRQQMFKLQNQQLQHQVLQHKTIHQQQQEQQLPQQQVLQPQPQQLQHQVQQQLPQPQQLPPQMQQAVQPVAIDQQPLGLPQQHRQQVPQLQTQQPYDQPQQFVQAGAMAQQQEGWLEPQPHQKVSLGPPGQPVEKVTNSDVNVDQDQVQSPPTSSSVREDISAGLIENEVTLAWLKTKV